MRRLSYPRVIARDGGTAAQPTGLRAPSTAHFHAWSIASTERDDFGSVRMFECSCGARHYDACA